MNEMGDFFVIFFNLINLFQINGDSNRIIYNQVILLNGLNLKFPKRNIRHNTLNQIVVDCNLCGKKWCGNVSKFG